jgi:hypothetical protein
MNRQPEDNKFIFFIDPRFSLLSLSLNLNLNLNLNFGLSLNMNILFTIPPPLKLIVHYLFPLHSKTPTMRWVLSNTLNQSHYWILNGSDPKVELRYNSEAHSIRLNIPDKRLFFLERGGFLQNRILLKTEYNVVAGEHYCSRNWRTGILIQDKQKLSFSVDSDRLLLWTRQKELFVESTIEGLKGLDLFEFSGLLFALGKIYRRPYSIRPETAGSYLDAAPASF